MNISLIALAGSALLLAAVGRSEALVVSNFDDLPLSPNSYFDPAATTTFTSGAASFDYRYNAAWASWDGWVYSNVTDQTTPGFMNQYSAYNPPSGGGVGSSAGSVNNFAVSYLVPATDAMSELSLAKPGSVSGTYVTNTTYAALSMRDGDSFAKKFGGASGNDPDYFKLTISGLDAGGQGTGSVDFYLADYRFADNAQDYIVDGWTLVDLSALGTVSKIRFTLASTDTGAFGMNTPAYFALDDLGVTPVPEPATVALMLGGLALLGGVARRRRAA